MTISGISVPPNGREPCASSHRLNLAVYVWYSAHTEPRPSHILSDWCEVQVKFSSWKSSHDFQQAFNIPEQIIKQTPLKMKVENLNSDVAVFQIATFRMCCNSQGLRRNPKFGQIPVRHWQIDIFRGIKNTLCASLFSKLDTKTEQNAQLYETQSRILLGDFQTADSLVMTVTGGDRILRSALIKSVLTALTAAISPCDQKWRERKSSMRKSNAQKTTHFWLGLCTDWVRFKNRPDASDYEWNNTGV